MSLVRQQTLYNQLLGVPLFCGMTRYELEYAVSTVGAGFQRLRRRTVLAQGGQACGEVFFLIDGTLETDTPSNDGEYRIVEHISRPTLLSLGDMFSLAARYRTTITAGGTDDVAILRLTKAQLLQLSEHSTTMHINLLHILARHITHQRDALWQERSDDPRTRLAHFLAAHTITPCGCKEIVIHKTRLATELGIRRQHLPEFLAALENEGLAKPARGRLIIPEANKLMGRQ